MYKTYCYGTQHSALEQLLDNNTQKRLSYQEGVITLRLSQNMFEGSTGCHEWEAGFFLAEYILNHPELVRGAPPLPNGHTWILQKSCTQRSPAFKIRSCPIIAQGCWTALLYDGHRHV